MHDWLPMLQDSHNIVWLKIYNKCVIFAWFLNEKGWLHTSTILYIFSFNLVCTSFQDACVIEIWWCTQDPMKDCNLCPFSPIGTPFSLYSTTIFSLVLLILVMSCINVSPLVFLFSFFGASTCSNSFVFALSKSTLTSSNPSAKSSWLASSIV